jgi:hypothetical protein
MENTWIVIPVRDNELDLNDTLVKLNGTYICPEGYSGFEYNQETKEFAEAEKDHPHAFEVGPDFTNRIILIHLNDGYSAVAGTVQLEDFGPINIYRTWNKGIKHAFDNGADSVVLFNAVLDIDPFIISDSYDLMIEEDTEVVNISDGAVVMISAQSGIRADEQFRIWFGDNDLYRRAEGVSSTFRADWASVTQLDNIEFDDEFKAIVAEDELKFQAKYE